MGFDEIEILSTSLRDPKTQAERLAEMDKKISNIVNNWYKKPSESF
jgi:hypothetical protein